MTTFQHLFNTWYITICLLTATTLSSQIHFVTQHIPINFKSSYANDNTNPPPTPFQSSRILPTPTFLHQHKCIHPLRTAIDWSAQVESSVYSTPIIRTTGMHHGNVLSADSILASTYVHFIESLNAKTGHVLSGWPLEFDSNEFPSSPILYDVNHDGNKEIIIVNKRGHLVVIYVTEAGTFLRDDIIFPFKLRIQKEDKDDKDDNNDKWEWITRVLSLEHQQEYQKPERSSGKISNTVLGPGHRVVDPRMKKKKKKNNNNKKMKDYDWRIDSWNELMRPSSSLKMTKEGEMERNGKEDEKKSGWTTLTGHVLASPTLHNGKLYLVTSYFDDDDDEKKTATVDDKIKTTRKKSLSSAIAVSCWTLGVVCDDDDGSSSSSEGCRPSTYPSQQWTTIVETSSIVRLTAYSSPVVVDLNGDGQLDVLVGTSSGRIHNIDATKGTLKKKGFSSLRFGEIQGDISIEDLNSKSSSSSHLNIIIVDMSGNIVCLNHDGSMVWNVNVRSTIPSGASLVRSGQEVHVYVVTSTGDLWGFCGSDGQLVQGYPLKLTHSRLITSVTPMVVRRQLLSEIAGRPVTEVLADVERSGRDGGRNDRDGSSSNGNDLMKEELHLIVPAMDGKLYIVGDRVDRGGGKKCTNVIDVGEHMYADVIVRGTIPNDHVHFHPNVGRSSGGSSSSSDGQLQFEMGHQQPLLTSFVVSTMHGNIMSIVVDDSTYMSHDQWNGGSGSFRRVALDVGDGAITLLDEGSSSSSNIGRDGEGEEGTHRNVHVVVGHTFHIRFYLHAARKRRQGPYNVVVRHGSIVVGRASYTLSGAHTMILSLDTPGVFVLDVTSTNAHQLSYTTTLVVDYNTQVASSVVNMLTIPMVLFTFMFVALTFSELPGSSKKDS